MVDKDKVKKARDYLNEILAIPESKSSTTDEERLENALEELRELED